MAQQQPTLTTNITTTTNPAISAYRPNSPLNGSTPKVDDTGEISGETAGGLGHNTDIPLSSGGNVASRSLIKSLSFLDRFLALWILLAMALGIILGYFVSDVDDVLQAATLIGVSAPIGMSPLFVSFMCCHWFGVSIFVSVDRSRVARLS